MLAILKSKGADEIYTDDLGLANRARLCGIKPIGIAALPLPPDEIQMKLELEPHDDIPEAKSDNADSDP